jgi:hypothetical protein
LPKLADDNLVIRGFVELAHKRLIGGASGSPADTGRLCHSGFG